MQILNFYACGRKIPENAIYIGRASAKHGLAKSPYANPFPMRSEEERGAVIENYRRWLAGQVASGAITKQSLAALDGHDLVCYCAPKACHGHVLRSAVQWAVRELATTQTQESRARRLGPP